MFILLKALKFLEHLFCFGRSNQPTNQGYLKFEAKDNAKLGIQKFKFLRFKKYLQFGEFKVTANAFSIQFKIYVLL